MAIKLNKETTEALAESIKKYFHEEFDLELGDLRAGLVLDYVLQEVGPSVYNEAIRHAQRYFQERALDLDGSCHEEELTYWQPKRKR